MHLPTYRSVLPLVAVLLLTACGGSGGGAGPGGGGGGLMLNYYLGIGGEDSRDGHVFSNGIVQTHLDTSAVGDSFDDKGIRVFMSFPLSEIPADAIVTKATLIVRTTEIHGDFYGNVPLVVDHMDIGANLDAIDYYLAPRTPGPIEAGGVIGYANVHWDVTDEVLFDLADGRTFIDFRQRFAIETDLDGSHDGGRVKTAAPGPIEDRTHLLIEYHLP